MSILAKTLTLKIERLAHGGEGVAHHEGKAIFVPFAVPGDTLRVEIEVDKPRYARGRIDEILESSAERVEPRCPLFGQCGGCQWQHIDYMAQVRHKETIFRETLERIGRIEAPPLEPIIASDQPWNYRRRIQLKNDNAGSVGFYAYGSHDVVPMSHCDICDPHLNEVLAQGKVPARDLELSWNGQEITLRYGEHRSFEQAHPGQNQQLVQTVRDYVAPRSHQQVLELYCGNGNFTRALAPELKHIFAIDENAEAIGRAERRIRRLGCKGVHLLVGTATWGLKKVIRDQQAIDTLLIDPPRAGVKAILNLVAKLNPQRIVYVSCDPASLARDLRYLIEHGYRLARTRPIDMFPQTYHIESVTELVRAE